MEMKELGDGGFEFVAGNGQTYRAAPLTLEDEGLYDAWICGERVRRLQALGATGEVRVTTEALLQAVIPPDYSERLRWMQSAEGGIQLVAMSLRKAKPDLTLEAVRFILKDKSDILALVLRINGYVRPEKPADPKAPADTTSPAPGS